MKKLVLLRHGESLWNRENRFTGWMDVGLSPQGLAEAREAGRVLAQEGFEFDVAFSSVLRRAIKTLWVVLEEMDRMWIPVHQSWRLNERHYGALQGQTVAWHRLEQVQFWRRSYDVPPPSITPDHPHFPGTDPRYAGVPPGRLPLAECLQDVESRVLPYWLETIAPAVAAGRRAIIVAHCNSLRTLVKHLDRVPHEAVVRLNIPTGIPLIYELTDDLKPIRHYYLG